MDAAQLGSRRVDRALQEGRRENLRSAGESSLQLRRLGFEAPPLELLIRRSTPGCRRRLGRRSSKAGIALRGHCAPGPELVVVSALSWCGQIRTAGRRSIRWRSYRGTGQGTVVAGARSAAPLLREASRRRVTGCFLREELLR